MADLISIKTKGMNSLINKTKKINRVFKNKRGVNLGAAILIQRWTIKNIEAEGKNHDDSRFRWPALKASTIAARRQGKKSGTVKMLQDTGRLKGAFRATADNNKGTVVNNVGYAGTHEFGTSKVPRRKIWPSEAQAAKIAKPAYELWVKGAVK